MSSNLRPIEIISDEIFSKGFLVLFRLLPIIMLIPGGHYIPIKIKVLFSISFSILIALILENNFNSSPELITYVYEGLIGLTIGLSIRILFHAVTIAAQFIAAQSGLSQAIIFNPGSADQENILAKFFLILTVAMFFVTDTHTLILLSIINTYDIFQPQVEIEKYSSIIITL